MVQSRERERERERERDGERKGEKEGENGKKERGFSSLYKWLKNISKTRGVLQCRRGVSVCVCKRKERSVFM